MISRSIRLLSVAAILAGVFCLVSFGASNYRSVNNSSGAAGVKIVAVAQAASILDNPNDSWYENWVNRVKATLAKWGNTLSNWGINLYSSAPKMPATINSQNTNSAPKATTSAPTFNIPSSTGVGGDGAGSGTDQYGSNGSNKKPWVLEPNQFKKVCGKNEYVLWWSKRGTDGKDMKEERDMMQNNYLVVPSCKELAKCHCCCNTCTKPGGEVCPPDICFSNMSPCDGSKDCTPKCQCPLCKSTCESYTQPFHPKAFDTDCSCSQEGCPDGKGCKIVLFENESGWLWGNYDQNGFQQDKETQNNPPKKPTTIDNSSKIVGFNSKSADAAKGNQGWIDKLVQDKGKCCKCVDEETAKKGPNGSSGGGGGAGGGSGLPSPSIKSGSGSGSGTANTNTNTNSAKILIIDPVTGSVISVDKTKVQDYLNKGWILPGS